MSFDDIPEDRQQEFPCPECSNGSVYFNKEVEQWLCDTCDFSADNTPPAKATTENLGEVK